MNIIPNYKNAVTVIPTDVLKYLPDASKEDIITLLYILSEPEFDSDELASKLKITSDKLFLSLHFWEEHGIISTGSTTEAKTESEKTAAPKEKAKRARKQKTTLPSYTTEETARFLENNRETAALLDGCQQILGKILSSAETSIIIGLLDHLSLDTDYILLLCAYAVKHNKKSVRYIETLAISLFDKDVTSYDALAEELRNIEESEDLISRVRRIFGIGKRSLTSKEKGIVYNWCAKWKYDEDIITKAYEITVNNTNAPSLPYANAILENWHNNDLKTIEEVENFIDNQNREKAQASDSKSSFDTDDFFEAALKRSYGEN